MFWETGGDRSKQVYFHHVFLSFFIFQWFWLFWDFAIYKKLSAATAQLGFSPLFPEQTDRQTVPSLPSQGPYGLFKGNTHSRVYMCLYVFICVFNTFLHVLYMFLKFCIGFKEGIVKGMYIVLNIF